MRQVACNATLEGIGPLNGCRYVLHDRDAKFCPEFRETLAAGGVKCLRLPPHSPNWNAFAERWVRSVKEECLSHLILFGERSLRKALLQFQEHYHQERNHQGKNNVLLFPDPARLEPGRRRGMRCRERLAGLLRYYGPGRHPLAFARFPGFAGYTIYLAPPISRWDEDGFSGVRHRSDEEPLIKDAAPPSNLQTCR